MADVERPEMTLRDYWGVAWRRKWVIVAAIITTVAPAVVLSSMQPPVYVSSGDVLIDTSSRDTIFGSGAGGYIDPDRVLQNQISLLQSAEVATRTQERLGIADGFPFVTGFAPQYNDLVQVSVQSGDPATAAILVDAYMESFAEVARERAVGRLDDAAAELQLKISDLELQIDALDDQLTGTELADQRLEADRRVLVDQQAGFKQTLSQIQVDAALETGGVQVVRPAFVPVEPTEPNPTRTAMLAVVVGLLLGLGAAFLIDHLDDSVRSPEDVSKIGRDLPVLSIVPTDPPPDDRPIALSKPDDPAIEAYRTLRTNIQFLGLERDMKVVQLTSAVPGEGKTTTASNLAVVLAQTGASVVVVDGDLRKPRIHRVFTTDGTLGLTNNLVGDPVDLTLTPIAPNLWVIPSGRVPPNPSEMLASRHMAALVAELKARFDYVIIDSAPCLSVSDAVALSQHVDGVVAVVHAGRTSAPQVRKALASLEQVGAPLLGIVLNRAAAKYAATDGGDYQYGYVEPASRTGGSRRDATRTEPARR